MAPESWWLLTTVTRALVRAPQAGLPGGRASALVSLSWQPVIRIPTSEGSSVVLGAAPVFCQGTSRQQMVASVRAALVAML